jgi:hypothetical protein
LIQLTDRFLLSACAERCTQHNHPDNPTARPVHLTALSV